MKQNHEICQKNPKETADNIHKAGDCPGVCVCQETRAAEQKRELSVPNVTLNARLQVVSYPGALKTDDFLGLLYSVLWESWNSFEIICNRPVGKRQPRSYSTPNNPILACQEIFSSCEEVLIERCFGGIQCNKRKKKKEPIDQCKLRYLFPNISTGTFHQNTSVKRSADKFFQGLQDLFMVRWFQRKQLNLPLGTFLLHCALWAFRFWNGKVKSEKSNSVTPADNGFIAFCWFYRSSCLKLRQKKSQTKIHSTPADLSGHCC